MALHYAARIGRKAESIVYFLSSLRSLLSGSEAAVLSVNFSEIGHFPDYIFVETIFARPILQVIPSEGGQRSLLS